MTLMNNTKYDYINNQYLSNVKEIYKKIVLSYLDCFYELENNDNTINNSTKENIIYNADKATTYFQKLFDANSDKEYLNGINNIIDSLDLCNKTNIVFESKNTNEFGASKEYKFITTNIKKIINKLGYPIEFDYVLKQVNNQKEFINIENISNSQIIQDFNLTNEGELSSLLNLVISKLKKIESIIKTYGLLSIQEIDFSVSNYNYLKDVLKKDEYSKKYFLDVREIINIINDKDKDNYNNIYSEDYIDFIGSLLEISYFLIVYYGNKFNNELELKIETNNFDDSLENFIIDNINLFLDRINRDYEFDFLENYIEVYNEFVAFSKDKVVNELKVC